MVVHHRRVVVRFSRTNQIIWFENITTTTVVEKFPVAQRHQVIFVLIVQSSHLYAMIPSMYWIGIARVLPETAGIRSNQTPGCLQDYTHRIITSNLFETSLGQ